MSNDRIGEVLFRLRKERNLTQKQVAEALHVSTQAVSKWERGLGCPDVSLLPQVAEYFGISMERLLQGNLQPARPEPGNARRMKFYVCPVCGNIFSAFAGAELHCCGRKVGALPVQKADEEHAVSVVEMDDEWYITFRHPMEKAHYIRFAAFLTVDKMLMVRLYPEQGSEFRMPQVRGGGRLYLGCSQHGLFEVWKR